MGLGSVNVFFFQVQRTASVALTLARWGWRGSGVWLTLRGKWAEPQKDFSSGRGTEEDTQQRSKASRAEWRTGRTMRPKDPPKRRNSHENATPARADAGG